MMEQIKRAEANYNGNVIYFVKDNEKGVPYAAVTVQPDGDYWLTVYGVYSFGRLVHDKILKVAKPAGKDITAEKFFKKC